MSMLVCLSFHHQIDSYFRMSTSESTEITILTVAAQSKQCVRNMRPFAFLIVS